MERVTDAATAAAVPYKRSLMEMSADARFLYQYLVKVPAGATAPYEDLSAVIHRNVQSQARAALTTAIRHARRENGMVFEAVRGVGVKRLTDAEIARDVGTATITKVRRASRRGLEKMHCADFASLDNEGKKGFATSVSMLATIHAFSTEKSRRCVQQEIGNTSVRELPVARTIEAFRSS